MEKHTQSISRAGIVLLAAFLVVAAAPGAIAQTPISQAGWTLQSVDSEDLCCGGAYLATKGFDGNPATFWHTVWSNGAPPPPHEIKIDLGSSHSISGFRYLPRQDGSPNGRIGQYEFYVSTDGSNWGAAVASGALNNVGTEQQVLFATPKVGRYVWLKALTEVEGRPYTSMAELNVLTGGGSTPTASAEYGVGVVKVKRGSADATIWAYYSTLLGSPVGADAFSPGGDNTGGTFRFTCNNTSHNSRCEISLAAAVLSDATGERDNYVYPRVLIQRQDFVNAQAQFYCEYGDGSTGAGLKKIETQPTSTSPGNVIYTPMDINIGGTADCAGTPVTTAGDVSVITVGAGYYDVFTTFVFKKPVFP